MTKMSSQPQSSMTDTMARDILNRIPGMVVVYNTQTGEYLYVNKSVKTLLGYNPGDFTSGGYQFVVSLVHPDDLPVIMAKNQKALEQANRNAKAQKDISPIATFEYRMKHKDGTYRWLHTDGVVFERDTKGKVKHVMNISIDITGRKETELKDAEKRVKFEHALYAGQERLKIALKAGKIGIWDWDIVNNNINWTERVYEIHGVRKDTKIGELEKYKSHHHPEDVLRVQKAIEAALEGKKNYEEEFRIITPRGKIKWVETKAHVIRDLANKPIRMMGSTIDITTRKNLEQQKDEFIGIASHELKTPVTSIKAYAQLLESRFRKEGQENSALLLGKMNTQLNKLTSLIGDLLDVTKLETGKLEFHEEYFDFNDMVTEIVSEIELTTEKHKLVIKLAPPTKVYGDRDRIGQVLTNFLTNAVKYSPHADKIEITTQKDNGMMSVAVRDFGIGIKKEHHDKVFDRFFRIVTSSGQTFPGMGLGLYISSQIIARQQGRIWVESHKGQQGSTFSFSIPIKRNKIK